MLLNLKSLILISSVALIILSCGGNKTEELDNFQAEAPNQGIDSSSSYAKNVFNTIPSRIEITELIKDAKSEYNVAYLNNPDDVNKYLNESSKALNFGIYGTDLNIASIYEQHQESMLFFKCVNILAKSIGVNNSFNENLGDRINANQSNRDSTLIIINEAFKDADKTLRDNGRPGTSALLIAGAWIEGIYVACQTAKEVKNDRMIQVIYNQKESLNHLISLLEASPLEKEVDYIISNLKSLQKLFIAKNNMNFGLEDLKNIDQKITELRTKIISSK